ncbi:hypothetical protein LPMP_250860 [Leishmania panamensis]|uniref:PH domain-containing protein n=2 Tax=Leishmania guyanensis species complex TaxID=38579 RepID=A0A088RUJ8_LEIPA|nr:hypothetical protein LPMP_250860 [Leishmania panamensis]AIN98949.1 hypothetical protein LPMP_250860 [Leishmania panamensis]
MILPPHDAEPLAAKQTLSQPAPPLCEGWLEKLALCRGLFAKKGWHRRYVFATHEGLGLCHTNPRDKGNCARGRPLRIRHAKSFISFVKRRNGEMELQPVYIVDDVSAARHPEAPKKSYNGICSETMSLIEGTSNSTSTRDLSRFTSATNGNSCTYYYFGLTFEEYSRRYLLLFRTTSPQEYIKWTTCLPLYVHEGSASRIVPLGHPLEAGRQQPIDVNHRRLTERREWRLPNATFYLDPDPCTLAEHLKVRRLCLSWDEGERRRLFTTATERVCSLCGKSESAASAFITELQEQSEEKHRNAMFSLFEELSPTMFEYEEQHSARYRDSSEPKRVAAAISSVGMAANSSGAAHPPATQVDSAEDAAEYLSMGESTNQSASRRPLSRIPDSGGGAGSGSKEAHKHPRLEKAGATPYSDSPNK